MRIPEHRPPFALQTLLVLANTTEAKGYLAKGHEITPAFHIEEEKHPYQSGDPAIMQTPGGGQSSSEHEHVAEERRDRLFVKLLNELKTGIEAAQWHEIYLALPQSELAGFLQSLPAQIQKHIVGTLGKNLLGITETEAITALEASRTHLQAE